MVQNTNQTTQTTVTTRTTPIQQGIAPGSNLQQAKVLNKEAIVTNVTERPVLENVIEKKNVEIHHKPVVQEIHEQKIIEIEKQPVFQSVNQGTVVQQQKAATRFEEIGSDSLSEQERLRLQQLNATHAPHIVQQQGAVRQVQEGEQVAQVVRQEFIEHHVQPVVTEIREQDVIQEVVHPVVRKVHEGTIIREVQGSTMPLQQNLTSTTTGFQQGTTLQSGLQKGSGWQQGSGLQQGTTLQSGLQQQSGWQQGSGLQSGLQQQSGWQQGAPLQSGLQQGSGWQQGSGLQSGLQQQSGWQQGAPMQQGFQQGGSLATTKTTTMGSGISGTTTTTSGMNPIQAEQRNLLTHEQKLLQKDAPLSSTERQNLAVHEQAVDSVVKGQSGWTGTGSAPLTTGTGYSAPMTSGTTTGTQWTAPVTTGTTTTTGTGGTTSGAHLGNEQKPGFMGRMKEKLHLGHHNTTK